MYDASDVLQTKHPSLTPQHELLAENEDPKSERLFAETMCLGNDNLIKEESALLRSEAITVRGFRVPMPM